jgi:diaminohydroxyphosphoribosylaminopyrimidine deaminase / 5-amino-6-(5-phosphoribosylamino)uracil reductase
VIIEQNVVFRVFEFNFVKHDLSNFKYYSFLRVNLTKLFPSIETVIPKEIGLKNIFFETTHEAPFLRRCFDLARLGAGGVAPNPMVGAVLVNAGRIIGEGYHRQHGGPHAEVEAIRSVQPSDRALISESTLYVSLEPCCIYGRTPPCTNLILEMGIPRVVIANLDLTPGVNGQGVRQLREAGVEVHTGVLEAEGEPFCRIRNCFVSRNRPYVILKYAQSADGYLGRVNEKLWLSDEVSKRLVHKWRSETGAILAGTHTLRVDDPELTNRLFYGKSPVRLALDQAGTLPSDRKVFHRGVPTWVFTENPDAFAKMPNTLRVITAPFGQGLIPFILEKLAEEKITSLMVEGGQKLLAAFIEGGWWDEARTLVAPVYLGGGIPAPTLPGKPQETMQFSADRLLLWENDGLKR